MLLGRGSRRSSSARTAGLPCVLLAFIALSVMSPNLWTQAEFVQRWDSQLGDVWRSRRRRPRWRRRDRLAQCGFGISDRAGPPGHAHAERATRRTGIPAANRLRAAAAHINPSYAIESKLYERRMPLIQADGRVNAATLRLGVIVVWWPLLATLMIAQGRAASLRAGRRPCRAVTLPLACSRGEYAEKSYGQVHLRWSEAYRRISVKPLPGRSRRHSRQESEDCSSGWQGPRWLRVRDLRSRASPARMSCD